MLLAHCQLMLLLLLLLLGRHAAGMPCAAESRATAAAYYLKMPNICNGNEAQKIYSRLKLATQSELSCLSG
jgi:hypothetical protein